jgi:excisionase family DNA binding protein
MQNLLDVREAAELLGISRWTIERMKALHKIPFCRIGRRTLYDPQDLADWVEAKKVVVRE